MTSFYRWWRHHDVWRHFLTSKITSIDVDNWDGLMLKISSQYLFWFKSYDKFKFCRSRDHFTAYTAKLLPLKVNCDRLAYRIDLKFSGVIQSIKGYSEISRFLKIWKTLKVIAQNPQKPLFWLFWSVKYTH